MRNKILTAILVISAGCVLFGVSQNIYACGTPPPPTPPTAVLTAPSIATHSGSTQFDGSSSTGGDGTIVKYEWDWNNDANNYEECTTTATTSHVFNLSGGESTHTYYVTLKVTNSLGSSDTDTQTVTVRKVHRISGSNHYGYDTIGDAISAASSGDTIEVGDGTYTGSSNRNLSWSGKYITLKSANGPAKCVIDCNESARGFYLVNSTGTDHIIGFTVKNGKATTDWQNNNGHGGGIYCSGSSAHIEDCVITDNISGIGGGIAAEGASPTLTNCTISSNMVNAYYADGQDDAARGGGIYAKNGANIVVTDCTISENYAGWGGGIYCVGITPTISYCSITKNDAGGGGGVEFNNCSSSGTIYKSVIAENIADFYAGILCWEGDQTKIDSCRIINNAMYDLPHSFGGGIICFGASSTIVNCVISDNDGGGEIAGGGIFCASTSCQGKNCHVTVKNCTLNNNKGGAAFGGGGGGYTIYSEGADIDLVNTIIWRTDGLNGDEIALTELGGCSGIYAHMNLTYGDLKGGESNIYCRQGCSYTYQNMITSDPNFKETGAGDYRLLAGSGCINGGTSSAGVTVDIIGTSRSSPDIGAYEGNPSAQTIPVAATGANYTAIQRAIDWANNEDTVEIDDGVYKGPANTNLGWTANSKDITVASVNGAANCIIDCQGNGRGFDLDVAGYYIPKPYFVIDGLTIKNAGDTGIYCFGDWEHVLPVNITNCVVSGCSEGGIFVRDSSANIKNCTITGCSNWGGGGIYCYNSYSTPEINIENCTITGNIATSGSGGGILIWGDDRNAVVRNCLIAGNNCTEDYGGGIYTDSSSDTIINCTITGNQAWYGGSGIEAASTTPIINCVVWANSYDEIDNGNVTYSCVKGGRSGTGNISDDPCFVNLYKLADVTTAAGSTTTIYVYDVSQNQYAVDDYIEYNNDGVKRRVTAIQNQSGYWNDIVTFANDPLSSNSASHVLVYNWGNTATSLYKNYHLRSSSPCVDVGDSGRSYVGQTDIDGENRVIDISGKGDGTNDVDMGADEVFGPYLIVSGSDGSAEKVWKYRMGSFGTPLWSYTVDGGLHPNSVPVGSDGSVYCSYLKANGYSGVKLTASGQEDTGWASSGFINVYPGYSGVNVRWGSDVLAAPDGITYWGAEYYDEGYISKYSANGQTRLYSNTFAEDVTVMCWASDGDIQVGTDGYGYNVNKCQASDLDYVWQRLWSNHNIQSACADTSGNSYWGSYYCDSVNVAKYDSSGTQQWTSAVGTAYVNSLVVLNGKLYAAGTRSNSKSIWQLNLSTGAVENSADTGVTTLAITTDGTYVYVGGANSGGYSVWRFNSDLSNKVNLIDAGDMVVGLTMSEN